MEKYWVMINYGAYEGWKIHLKTDDWDAAVAAWEEAMSFGNEDVRILEPIPLKITDRRVERR